MKRHIKLMLLLAVMFMPFSESIGQSVQFKAMYLYKFAKGVSWPANATGDLIVTIVGDNEMATAFKKSIATRKIGSRNIIVNVASTINQTANADVIYLGESKADQIQKLVEMHKDKQVLIVSGKAGWCEHGACISFVNKNGALSYEVSNKNIQQHKLQCSQELVRLGTNVD